MSSVSSMTGFATAQGDTPLGHITVELRCVNSRFLDIQTRMHDDLRFCEPLIYEAVKKNVGRGKLECRISLKAAGPTESSQLNPEAIASLVRMQSGVVAAFPDARPLSVFEVLSSPGVVAAPEVDRDAAATAVLGIAEKALASFCSSREREGAALAAVLAGYCDRIEEIVTEVSRAMPEILTAAKNRLEERLSDALAKSLSENSSLSAEDVTERIRQEVTLYALKVDVDEEINRLQTHTAEVRRVLAGGGPVGRRLDFLMQEMNREANTLGSKAATVGMSDASVNLKLLIEQMREQIQNLQ